MLTIVRSFHIYFKNQKPSRTCFEFLKNNSYKINIWRSSPEKLAFKMPTIFTVFSFLIALVCLFVVSYVVCMLFCYISKRGLFRPPKIIIVSEVLEASSYDDSTADSAAQPPRSPQQRQHAHCSGSCSSSSSSSSNASSPSLPRGASHSTRRDRPQPHSKSTRPPPTQQQPPPPPPPNGHRPRRGDANTRSPTARVTVAVNSPQPSASAAMRPSTSRGPGRRQASEAGRPSTSRHTRDSHLCAEPECYVDLEAESPFLVPFVRQPSNSKRTAAPAATSRSGPRVTNGHLGPTHSSAGSSSVSLDMDARSLLLEQADTASESVPEVSRDDRRGARRVAERQVEVSSQATTNVDMVGGEANDERGSAPPPPPPSCPCRARSTWTRSRPRTRRSSEIAAHMPEFLAVHVIKQMKQ